MVLGTAQSGCERELGSAGITSGGGHVCKGKVISKTQRAYNLIDSLRGEFSIQMTCRLLGVARADDNS